MCINPIKIKNRSFIITRNDQLYYEVPCGKCYQCQLSERNQWAFRSLQEMQDTINRNGYIYFDTLTYAPAYLPTISLFLDQQLPEELDFPCFSRHDVQKFLKRLRINIKRKYGIAKDCFKYFLSSEYGTDERYTHRPHYHIIFFVKSQIISPLDFSWLVADAWHYGRTDGGPYRSPHYIRTHSILDARTPDINRLRVTYYISKYVQKDSYFQKEINKRLSKLARYFNYDTKELFSEWFNHAKRYVSQFHLQSLGFGNTYTVDWSQYLKTGYILMPVPGEEQKKIPIPQYYLRKSLYDCVYLGGKKLWSLTRFGKKVKNNMRHLAQKKYAEKIQSIEFNEQFQKHVKNIQKRLQRHYKKKDFKELLTEYSFHLRWRANPDAYTHVMSLEDKLNCRDKWYNYTSKEDMRHFGSSYLSRHWLGDDKIGYTITLEHFQLHNPICHQSYLDAMGLVDQNGYYQNHNYQDSEFENYLHHWKQANYEIELIKQQDYDENQRLARLHKAANMNYV